MSATLLSAWRHTFASKPEARALIDAASGTVFTRKQVDDHAEALARQWQEVAGDLTGKRVVFSQSNGLGSLGTFLALFKLGAVPVPLDPSEAPAAQAAIAQSIHAHFLLQGDNQLTAISTKHRRASRDICLIKLTSGSTGTPRALTFTHGQMLADGHQVCTSMDIRPNDLNLALIPLGHSYGLGNLLIPLLTQGTAMVCPSATLPHAIAEDIVRWQPTVFPSVPAMLRVLALIDLPPTALQGLRVIISAGSPLPAETARAFTDKFGKRIHNFYGSSETGGITYDRIGDATLEGRSVGTPLEGVTLTFTRGHRFTVSSASVFTQGNCKKTATGLGIHQPADQAEVNQQGELTLLGRAGRMVKIASRRLDLGALETELKKLPGIRDAFAIPHPQRTEELACALTTDLDNAAARSLLTRELAAWKIPRRLVTLKEFPLTPRGKPDTRALRELLGKNQ